MLFYLKLALVFHVELLENQERTTMQRHLLRDIQLNIINTSLYQDLTESVEFEILNIGT